MTVYSVLLLIRYIFRLNIFFNFNFNGYLKIKFIYQLSFVHIDIY